MILDTGVRYLLCVNAEIVITGTTSHQPDHKRKQKNKNQYPGR